MKVDIYSNVSEDSIDGDELALYNLIMQYRASFDLSSIQLSNALTIVAGRHVLDTVYNFGEYPVGAAGEHKGHSWSDAPYDGRDPSTYFSMWDAPDRLNTGYGNIGYEISIGYLSPHTDSIAISPKVALNGWQKSPGHNALLVNESPWTQEWKAIGIGMHQGVSHVWLGHSVDPTGSPVIDTSVNDSGSLASEALRDSDNDNANEGQYEVFRFYNFQNSMHFFTANKNERDGIIDVLDYMIYEGKVFNSYASQSSVDLPVYRFFNSDNGAHFYTANEREADIIRTSLEYFHEEGVAFYAHADASHGGAGLHRFLNKQNGSHFFTASLKERDHVIDTIDHFEYEGIAFYIDFV